MISLLEQVLFVLSKDSFAEALCSKADRMFCSLQEILSLHSLKSAVSLNLLLQLPQLFLLSLPLPRCRSFFPPPKHGLAHG